MLEDDDDDVFLIRDMLREAYLLDVVTDRAAALAEGLTMLAEGAYDVVLLDLTLPDSQGLETFSRVMDAAPLIPVVVLSGLDDETVAIRAVQEGAQDYLVKGNIDARFLARAIQYAIERKRFGEALRIAHDQLEARVVERTADLARANDELRAAIERLRAHDEAQTRFVSNVSHELRTPLSSMSYAIENLLRGVMGPVPEKMGTYLVMLKDDCLRLRNTVNDILDLSRMDNQRLVIARSPVLLPRLVVRAVESLRSNAESKNHTLRVLADCAPHFVSCDPAKVERVILNIVQNAIKYTPDGGCVEVLVHTPKEMPGKTVIDVVDDGVGIEPKHLHRIAERYYRIGEHVDGTGLGLYISKEILKRHGGSIEFESPPAGQERGTKATVVLPIGSPPTVLVVDNDPATRKDIESKLNLLGYGVKLAGHGNDALQQMRDKRPSAVLLNVFLPDVDGAEVLFRMKADSALRSVPVLALADRALDTPKRSILSGFSVPIMMKPWSEDSLLAGIENIFRQAAQQVSANEGTEKSETNANVDDVVREDSRTRVPERT